MDTATKKAIDTDSAENQRIKGQFVEREVMVCFSYEMEAILRAGQENPLPTYEDIENLYEYICPECGTGYQNEDEARKCCKIRGKLQSSKDIDNNPQEIMEWWIVSKFLYRKLRDRGEPVLQWGNNAFWGRTGTGQSILLDSVISEICLEMEILQGQRNDWGKNDTQQINENIPKTMQARSRLPL